MQTLEVHEGGQRCRPMRGMGVGKKVQTLEVHEGGTEVQTLEVHEGGQRCRPRRCTRGDKGAHP